MGWATPSSTLQGSSIPADRLTQRIREFTFVRRMGGGGAPVQDFQEAASQTFEAGQWVQLSTDGLIEEATDGGAGVLGIAMKDATGVTNAVCSVILGLPDVIFLGTATTAANVAQSLVGDIVDLDVTAGVHTIDENDSTDDLFRVVGLPTGATDSTHVNYGQLYIQVCSSQVGQVSEDAI